jgi:hypothetical protein
MFGELPGLLDREFLFGFFLPAALCVAASVLLGDHFGLLAGGEFLEFLESSPYLGTLTTVLAVWFVAGFLLALNSWIIRTKEGYGLWQPVFYPVKLVHRALYRRMTQVLEELDRKTAGYATREEVPARVRGARIYWAKALATGFPDEERWILPFSFGNAVRAFEAYSRVMYGLDPIAGWSRLVMVMPAESRRLVDSAKSQVDFLLNLWAVWWLVLIEYVGLAVWTGSFTLRWFPVVAVMGIAVCSWLARGAAIRWGDLVKAAFDVHLPKLRRELGLAPTPALDEEREIWEQLSRAFLYRDREELRRARAGAAAGTGPRRVPSDGPGSPGSSRGSS